MQSLEKPVGGNDAYRKGNKTEFMWEAISTLTSEFSRPDHIPQQQYLIYWKWCQLRYLKVSLKGYRSYGNLIYPMNKTGFLPSCGCVNTTVRIHRVDTNETHEENVLWERHKNAACYFEQTLEVVPHKTADVRPLTSNLTNHSNKTNKTYRAEQLR